MSVVVEPPLMDGRARATGAGSAPLRVDLVNNMPDSAVEGTETQFINLLGAAAGSREVRLRLTSLSAVPRGASIAARIAERYVAIDEVYRDPPDALIVTGTEPRAPQLADEPYWGQLVELLEFAQSQVHSSVWSCLAAHAAVQHLDGILRKRLPLKRCGVYQHRVLEGHPLTQGLAGSLPTPHSRWNDLPLDELVAAGYQILSQSEQTGADAFVRNGPALMLFFQGHPEYEERTLLKEFQRDVGRFVSQQQPNYPNLPVGYFSAEAQRLLERFESELRAGRLAEPMAAFPFASVAASLSNSWRGPSSRFYSNWLQHVAARKQAAAVPASRAL